jgi:hypothetical protein
MFGASVYSIWPFFATATKEVSLGLGVWLSRRCQRMRLYGRITTLLREIHADGGSRRCGKEKDLDGHKKRR